MRKRTIKIIDIDKLTTHPDQRTIFPDLGDIALGELAEDIARNGLQTPIEITSNYTIICGHQRVRAYRRIGLKQIDAELRTDLEADGEGAIRSRFIEDNFNRRHISKLGIARCYRELKRCGSELRNKLVIQGDTRDYLAERFGLSGRTLDRLEKMLEAPIEIQHAFEQNQLTQQQVLDFLKLPGNSRTEIVSRILNGELPSEVVVEYFAIGETRIVHTETILRNLVKSLQTAEEKIAPRKKELEKRKHRFSRQKIIDGITFLQEIVTLIPEVDPSEEEATELRELLN